MAEKSELNAQGLAREFLAQHYQTLRVLKESPRGTVALAAEQGTERLCVVKRIKALNLPYAALKKLPPVLWPEIYHVYEDEAAGETVVVEEYIAGENLAAFLASGKHLSAQEAKAFLLAFAEGLRVLHAAGILHRDIKPANIIREKGGGYRLLDFDAARQKGETAKEHDTRLLGTRGYAPPEQYGYGETDARSDLFALGMTARELLGECRGPLAPVLKKCTAVDAADRYQDSAALARAVRHAGKLYYGKRVSIAALAFLLLGTALFFATGQQEKTPPPEKIVQEIEENAEEAKESAADAVKAIEEKAGVTEKTAPPAPQKEETPALPQPAAQPASAGNAASTPAPAAPQRSGDIKVRYYLNGQRLIAWTENFSYMIDNAGAIWRVNPADFPDGHFLSSDRITVHVENDSDIVWENPLLHISYGYNKQTIRERTMQGDSLAPGESTDFVVRLENYPLPAVFYADDDSPEFHISIEGIGGQTVREPKVWVHVLNALE